MITMKFGWYRAMWMLLEKMSLKLCVWDMKRRNVSQARGWMDRLNAYCFARGMNAEYRWTKKNGWFQFMKNHALKIPVVGFQGHQYIVTIEPMVYKKPPFDDPCSAKCQKQFEEGVRQLTRVIRAAFDHKIMNQMYINKLIDKATWRGVQCF